MAIRNPPKPKAKKPARDPITHPYAYTVGASMYGGPSDRSTHGDTGYKGDHLTGKAAFAELEMGHALGNLPYKTRLLITYKGKQVVAEKLDIGLGGAPVSGHARRVDLWWQTAQMLGFNGTGLITIQRADGKPMKGPGAQTSEGTPQGIHVASTLEQVVGAGEETAETVGKAAASTLAVPEFLFKITSPENLLDAGKVLLGSVLLIVGLIQLGKVAFSTPSLGNAITDLTPLGATAKAVKKVTKVEAAKTAGHTARAEATSAAKVKTAQKTEAARRATVRAENKLY